MSDSSRQVLTLRRTPLVLAFATLLSVLSTSPGAAHVRITTDINWSNEIRAILRQHCMRCHSPSGIAPDYADFTTYGTGSEPGARAWATAIEEQILTGKMPPWSADPRYDHFSNSRALPQQDIDKIVAWVNGGGPQGPRRDLPPPPEFTLGEWELGPPDLVVEPAEEFVLAADEERGVVTRTIELDVEEDSWVTALEFKPDVPQAVYRISAVIIDPEGAEPESLEVEVQVPYDPFRDEDVPEPTRFREMPQGRRFLGQWAHGDAPRLFPDGAGRRLRRGSKVELTTEYRRSKNAPSGDIHDRSQLGLYLSQTVEEVDLIVEDIRVSADSKAKIRKNKPVIASTRLGEHVRLIGLNPRVADSAKTLEVRATYPDQRSVTLLYVPELDPDFPSTYLFREQIDAPAGTVIEMLGTFDGKGTVPSPFELVVDYAVDDHLVLPEPVKPPEDPASRGSMMAGAFAEDADILLSKGNGPAATKGSTTTAVDPNDPNAAAHMDHSPLHGGQFFMASNNFHHVEGALPNPGEFRLYVYDDFKKAIDPRNFAGEVTFEHWNEDSGEFSEESFDLEPIAGTDYLRAAIPEALPAEFFASLWLAGEKGRYDFFFEETTVEPVTLPTAPPGNAAHSHDRPPLTIPATAAGIVQELATRRDRVSQQIEERVWATLYVPAFDARDLAEALLEQLGGVAGRQVGQARRAISRIMQGAGELDRAGDLGDAGRARRALSRLNDGVDSLLQIFKN